MDPRAGRQSVSGLDPRHRSLHFLFAAALLLAGAAGCGRAKFQPVSPHETLLSIAAEFELLAARDPYVDPPAVELTGQHIARATLVRLANYRSLYPGRFTPEVLVLEGRAYERLADFESARRAFLEAAEEETALGEVALRRAAHLERLLEARHPPTRSGSLEDLLRSLQEQARACLRLAEEFDDPLYAALARVEAEQAQVRRAELLAVNRWVLPDGEAQALEAFRQLLATHSRSHRALEHALRLARYHRELAEEEIRMHPPGTIDFDRARVIGLIDQSLDLLYRVSQADGREERILAAKELDAVIALRELVIARSE